MDREDVEAKEEVLPERAIAYRVLQLPIGGGYHPGVDPKDRLGSDALKLPGLQRAEQLGLSLMAQIPDLVEKERPAVRQLEPSQAALRGTGKGSPFMTEHLGFDEVSRDRGAVDRDERARLAPAGPVNCGRDELLPRARFTGDEYPGLRRCHSSKSAP